VAVAVSLSRGRREGRDGTFVATAVAEKLACSLADVELEKIVGLVLVIRTGGTRLHYEFLARSLPHETLSFQEVRDVILCDGEMG